LILFYSATKNLVDLNLKIPVAKSRIAEGWCAVPFDAIVVEIEIPHLTNEKVSRTTDKWW